MEDRARRSDAARDDRKTSLRAASRARVSTAVEQSDRPAPAAEHDQTKGSEEIEWDEV